MEQDKANAGYALSKIGQLYQIERECDERDVTAEERKEIYWLKAEPIMEELQGWLEQIGVKYGSSTLLG